MLWAAADAALRAHPGGAEPQPALARGAPPSPAGKQQQLSCTLILWDAAGVRWRSQPFPFIALMGEPEAAAMLGADTGPFLQILPAASQPCEFFRGVAS